MHGGSLDNVWYTLNHTDRLPGVRMKGGVRPSHLPSESLACYAPIALNCSICTLAPVFEPVPSCVEVSCYIDLACFGAFHQTNKRRLLTPQLLHEPRSEWLFIKVAVPTDPAFVSSSQISLFIFHRVTNGSR